MASSMGKKERMRWIASSGNEIASFGAIKPIAGGFAALEGLRRTRSKSVLGGLQNAPAIGGLRHGNRNSRASFSLGEQVKGEG